jgi:TadE-like protein
MRGRILQRLRGESGQSFVEFTLILPIAMVLLLGVVDLGKAISYWLDSSHLANEGARYAAVGSCPGGGPCPNLAQAIKNQAASNQLRTDATVCISYPDPAVGRTFPDGDGSSGSRIEVRVTSTYNFIPFLHLASITVPGKSIMRIENASSGIGSCST